MNQKMQNDYQNINLSKHNKQINKPMQQNVQSERLQQGFNYSQKRNSIPSKLPDSQNNYQRYQTLNNPPSPNKLHIGNQNSSQKSNTQDKLKMINEQIQKQKQLIQKLQKQNQLQKQELQNTLNKSFLSLDHKQLQKPINDSSSSHQDQLLQTKTQADHSFLEGRKFQATKQLQTQEQKYRENIRKMQLKKTQMRKKLKEDQQIPIKIMNFQDLQRKKQLKQDELLNSEQINESNKMIDKQKQKKQDYEKSIEKMTKKSSQILLNEQNIPFQAVQGLKENVQKSQHSIHIKQQQQIVQSSILKEKAESKKQKQESIKNQQLSQKNSKKSQQQSQISVQNSVERKSVEQKSRISQKSSKKKYSVKISSVVVPEINDSIKQIQQRKSQKRYEKELSVKKSSVAKVSQQQESQSSRISSIIKGSVQKSIKSSKNVDNQCEFNENLNQAAQTISQKKSIQQKNSISKQKVNQRNSKQISVRSVQEQQLIEAKLNPSVKQKTVSERSRASSKKQEKNNFMYIPHAIKQPSHKSFKKTDKSIQWSEVDISMYGRTNQVGDESRLGSRVNNQQNYLIPERQSINGFSGVEVSRINMKKNKLINENNFLEISEKQMKSEKSINLVPLIVNKQKSQKSNHHTNSNRNSKASFIGSREGSVRQKVDRYEKFQRDHSLKSEKVQNKLAMIEDLDQHTPPATNKPASYRSRKSNPINGSSISKSRVSSVSKCEKSIKQQIQQKIQQNSTLNQKYSIEKNESRVLISKQQINLLLSHIQKLQQKLSFIEERQEKLAQQKTQEILKLQQLILHQEKQEEELQKSTVSNKVEHLQENSQGFENKIDQKVEENEKPNVEIQSVSQQQETAQKQAVAQNDQNCLYEQDVQNQEQKKLTTQNEEVQGLNAQIQNQPSNKMEEQVQIQNAELQKPVEQKNLHPELQKSQISQRQTIQHQINHLVEIQAKFSQERSNLLQQINRLKKVIRQMQIQKIKSIDHDKSILSNDNKSQRPATQYNQFGIIVNQNINQTIDQIKFEGKMNSLDEKEKIPYGKIVKNNSPGKNGSRLTQNIDNSSKSPQKKFRISMTKKSSVLSDSGVKNDNFESGEFLPAVSSNIKSDEEGNDSLLRKKNQSYPLNQTQGYVVVSNENQNTQKAQQSNVELQKNQYEQKELQSNQHISSRNSQFAKQEILQRFHRTNREFNNFVESSRLINETNSSLSSHNNLFDKTNRSESFVVNMDKKSFHNSEQDNPENKILHKASSSQLDLQINSNQKQHFQSSFTRIVNQIKDPQNQNYQQEDEQVPQIEISNIEFPQLLKTPDISYDQEQLMDLAIQTFKVFDIHVHNDDTDFSMKKYKNCVIFTKGSETILWHYNGKFYLGGWKGKQDGSGQKTGYGVQIVPDKHIYKGQFMNGKKHGTGIMRSTNGNIYDGQWIDGVKNGQGIYYDATTKVIYQGEWKDGKKNGFGILKFSPKQYYKGTFVKSVKDGYGTQVFVNGDKYRGEYRRGKFHGKGKYIWANTSVFEGDFNQGMRHGHGTWKSAKQNADIYVGSYENDKKSGYGRYVWSNGCIYEGSFAEDVKHGKGRLIYTDGRQIKGVWQEGSLLEAITENLKQYQQQDVLKRSRNFKIK